jgi:hypothetical protein
VRTLLAINGLVWPFGSGKSWLAFGRLRLEPRRGNTAAERAAVCWGSAFGSLPPVLDDACTEPYRELAKARFARSTRRIREAVAATSGIPPTEMKSILAAFPRLDMKRCFTDSVCRIVRTKPETTYDNFARDFGERFVPGYQRPSTVDFLMNAPFEG